MEKFLVPLYLPRWAYRALVRAKRVLTHPPEASINIEGERNIEWSFLSSEIPCGPGEAIEFGCENGYMSLVAAQKGLHVVANDLQEQAFGWRHSLIEFKSGNFLEIDLPNNYFDVAINCSSVEHVGVPGRYGITVEQQDGDIRVMQKLADILKDDGVLLMTFPCGRDSVLAPWCRVYGEVRLPLLLAPFETVKESYWVKDPSNRWVQCERDTAVSFQPRNHPTRGHSCAYALGCLVLRKGSHAEKEPPEPRDR